MKRLNYTLLCVLWVEVLQYLRCYMEVKEIFSKVLLELRKEKKLTQARLAEKAELETNFIGYMERGQRQPSITTIFKLAKGLEVSPTEIIKRVEQQYSH